MKFSHLALHALHLGLLRGASLLVPLAQRAEWRREWSNELWYVRRASVPIGAFSWCAEWEIVAFCMGAFQDAAFLWREGWRIKGNEEAAHGSAAQCLLWPTAVLALCAILAGLLPGIKSEEDAAQSPLRPGVILIQQGAADEIATPSISPAEYGEWRSHRQRFFAGLAFYRAERMSVAVEGLPEGEWMVAHASQSVFGVLGLPKVDAASAPRANLPQAMLSEAAWRRDFHSDPAVVGQVVTFAHRQAQIAGIVPAGWWRMPDHPDLWLLEPDTKLARGVDRAKGYVIARLSAAGQAAMIGDSVEITSAAPNGDEIELRGFAFAPPTSGPVSIYLFALLLAVLTLPAITSVWKSESNFTSRPPSLRSQAIRWCFLAAKLILIALVAYFASLDVAYWSFPNYSPTAEFLQFVASFCACLFGIRWALADQSQRCPVCLRHVTHPAQVGIASCTFLGWNGTEMICTGGHAILHVPSLPTSWFSSQRWTYLDASWDFLFADSRSRL